MDEWVYGVVATDYGSVLVNMSPSSVQRNICNHRQSAFNSLPFAYGAGDELLCRGSELVAQLALIVVVRKQDIRCSMA